MKLNYLFVITLLSIASLYAMEKLAELQPRGTAPSLKVLALTKKAKDINSFADAQTAIAGTPADLRCELVKAIIKSNNKLDIDELDKLVDQYCPGNRALKIIVLIKTYSNNPRQMDALKGDMDILAETAKKQGDELAYQVAASVSLAIAKKENPLSAALNTKMTNAAEFLLDMGIKPVVADLIKAVKNNDAQMVARLLDSGVPVEVPNGTIDEQPLTWAIHDNNKAIIDLLVKAGASLTKEYLIEKDFDRKIKLGDLMKFKEANK